LVNGIKPDVVATKQQEDEISITSYIYLSKMLELVTRAEVSKYWQFGELDSK
jgi:hypothetical protein